uniref:RING-type E3 ubiquitin transferase n=1 Tax=Zea mays TaxID=4577 RepID=B6SIM5_MAIZE|nr:RING-H2 finger protein ATL2K [Zea mays]|eukprot:NP_001146952.1 RING-H2 finger protein ATL2K [Zea mays]
MSMSTPNSWLFASDNSRYSTRARLLFMGLSFAIGILTFLLYLAIWYICSSRRRLLLRGRGRGRRHPSAPGIAAAEEEGDRGMSAAAIAALPTFALPTSAPALDCPVCLAQVEAGEKVRRLPKCAHSFHADCVDAWLRAHSTCPMCRAAVLVGPAAAAAATKQPDPAAAAAEALPPPV